MPILFVIKRSRKDLLALLKRVIERPGLVTVILDRRLSRRRHREAPISFPDRRERCRRQPLDVTAARTWAQLGVVVRQLRVLPTDQTGAAAPRAGSARRARRRATARKVAPRGPRARRRSAARRAR